MPDNIFDEKKDDLNKDGTIDYTEKLIKLKSLLDDGILTQEEFDTKKKQILNEGLGKSTETIKDEPKAEEPKSKKTLDKNETYCPKCGTIYSRKLKKCPNCGAKNKNRKRGVFGTILIVFGVLIVLGALFGGGDDSSSSSSTSSSSNSSKNEPIQEVVEISEEDYKASCGTYDYTDIARNPNNYVGKEAVFKAKVIQVVESSFGKTITFRMDTTEGEYGFWEDTIYVTYKKVDDNESRILEDDIVMVYGTLEGLETYTTVLGNQISIPKMSAKYIDLISE